MVCPSASSEPASWTGSSLPIPPSLTRDVGSPLLKNRSSWIQNGSGRQPSFSIAPPAPVAERPHQSTAVGTGRSPAAVGDGGKGPVRFAPAGAGPRPGRGRHRAGVDGRRQVTLNVWTTIDPVAVLMVMGSAPAATEGTVTTILDALALALAATVPKVTVALAR